MNDAEIRDLAEAVYAIIRPCSQTSDAKMAYSEVCDRLPGRWAGLDPRSPLLAAALGHIVKKCREAGLPALSAVVVHKSGDTQPGAGYYEAAHPEIEDPLEREIAWANEFNAVHRATYPPNLP